MNETQDTDEPNVLTGEIRKHPTPPQGGERSYILNIEGRGGEYLVLVRGKRYKMYESL